MSGRSVFVSLRALAVPATVGLVMSFVGFFAPAAIAGPGDKLDFKAARPASYTAVYPPAACPSGGRGSAPMAGAQYSDGVSSLMPSDLHLGQIVPFELRIKDPSSPTMTVNFQFGTRAQNGADFGFDPGFGMLCAFVDTSDTPYADTNSDAHVTAWGPGPAADTGNPIPGTFTVAGLDTNDEVVVEMWLVLKSVAPVKANSNVHASLDMPNMGNQTIPLDINGPFQPKPKPDVSIAKSDNPDPVAQNHNVTYTLTVTNGAQVPATAVTVTDTLDPHSSLVSATSTVGTCTGTGGAPPTGVSCNLGDLAKGQVVTITITVTVLASAPNNDSGTTAEDPLKNGTGCGSPVDLCNSATVDARGMAAPKTAYQPTNVLVPGPPPPVRTLGHVTVVKNLNGAVAGAPTSFTFHVSCPAVSYVTDLTIDGASTTHTASTPDAIPVGTACEVTETTSDPHWTLTSVAPASAASAVVGTATAASQDSATNTVTFVNTRSTGVITVQKKRVGDAAGASTTFTFELTCPAYVTAAGPAYPWAQQTLTVDTTSTKHAVATSSPIPTGVECDVAETPTAGWQQTEPAAGTEVPVTVPGTTSFVNTRSDGPLQVVKAVHTLAGPNDNDGSYVAGEPGNTLIYTLTLSETSPAQLDHTGVLVSDYLPGYGPDPGNVTTTYVDGSATCSTGCPVSYDPAEHQLSWKVGNFGHTDEPVVMTFRVTIDAPPTLANGAIPAGTVINVGWVQSKQQADTPSNKVMTPIVAVLGEKETRPLPFTGARVPIPLAWRLGALLVGVGIGLAAVRRRRLDGR